MDRLTPSERSANMRAIKGRDTKPEILIRSMLHRMGFRFRLHAKDLAGRPDVVFRRRRKAIFVHGCFWHRHQGCSKAYRPKSRADFWNAKLDANRQRDLRVQTALSELGWSILVVWECEAVDSEHLRNNLRRFVELGEPNGGHGD